MGDSTEPPTTTTIPSAPSVKEAPPASSSAPAPKKPVPSQANPTLLLRTLLKTDRTLLRLATLFSNPTTTDNLLCTTSYTLTLVSALLSRFLARTPTPTTSKIPATPTLARTSASLSALASVIADYRIFTRLWGTLGLYTWARSTYLSPSTSSTSRKDTLLRACTYTSILSCIAFQVLENAAYLSSKNVLSGFFESWRGEQGKKRENEVWLWSSRFWALYVGVEMARLGIERWYRAPSAPKDGAAKGEKEGTDKTGNDTTLWWRDLLSNAAYAPLTVHWSVDGGLLGDISVGALGAVAGGANLCVAWWATA